MFVRGLGILLPSIVTLWLLWQATAFVFENVGVPINRGIRAVLLSSAPQVWTDDSENAPDWFIVTPEELAEHRELNRGDFTDAARVAEVRRDSLREFWTGHWYLQFTGLLVAVLLIYLAGRLFGNYIGRRIYARLEGLIARIPGFKQVYPHVKQVVDLIVGDNSTMKAFREVALVQYPREGMWTVGLVTGESFQQVRDAAGEELVTIFVPTSPTPMTGFVINAPKKDTRKLDMTIDQALRFIITAGVLTPDNVVAEQEGDRGSEGGVKLVRANELAEEAVRGRDTGTDGPGVNTPDTGESRGA